MQQKSNEFHSETTSLKPWSDKLKNWRGKLGKLFIALGLAV